MSRRIPLAFALVAVLVACAPASAHAARSPKLTRGLDFLHSQQQTDGGFGSPSATAWAVLGAVATGERMGLQVWSVGGKNPVDYLQSVNHESAANSGSVTNPPVYYARAILAYIAAGRADLIYTAGTPHVDLVAKLAFYQDQVVSNPTFGAYSPANPSNPQVQAVRTTNWAILALHALNITDTRVTNAVGWLSGQAKTSGADQGGFPDQSADGADVTDTGLAVQALTAGGYSASSSVITDALSYLHNAQLGNAGFPDTTSGDHIIAESTSYAIGAIVAAGQNPEGAAWTRSGKTPVYALGTLQPAPGNGAYRHATGSKGSSPVAVTGLALVGIRQLSFTGYPRSRPEAVAHAFVPKPRFIKVTPGGGAKFTQTRTIVIHATYNDTTRGQKGTGIHVGAVRLYVDNVNRTQPASISSNHLKLTLKNVANGSHTYKIHLVDRAGNYRDLERTFTVEVATPTQAPTTTPTYAPTYTPPVVTPTHHTTPTPSTTLYPTPTPSTTTPYSPYPSTSGAPVTGNPVTSPSPGASSPPPGGSGTSGGGSAAGFLGGTLLAMLPIGAALSYFLFQRRANALASASEGEQLTAGGSSWDRVKGFLAKSKDIVKPAGS